MSETTTYVPEVGQVFYRSWGYDQTNVNFYKVVGVSKSGKSVTLREVGRTLVPGAGMVPSDELSSFEHCSKCGNIVSEDGGVWVHTHDGNVNGWDGHKATPFYRKLVRFYNGKPCMTFNSYSDLYLWDGKPKFDTIAFGYAGH